MLFVKNTVICIPVSHVVSKSKPLFVSLSLSSVSISMEDKRWVSAAETVCTSDLVNRDMNLSFLNKEHHVMLYLGAKAFWDY